MSSELEPATHSYSMIHNDILTSCSTDGRDCQLICCTPVIGSSTDDSKQASAATRRIFLYSFVDLGNHWRCFTCERGHGGVQGADHSMLLQRVIAYSDHTIELRVRVRTYNIRGFQSSPTT